MLQFNALRRTSEAVIYIVSSEKEAGERERTEGKREREGRKGRRKGGMETMKRRKKMNE
jgi:hypothetical protein